MTCPDARVQLSAFLDEALSAAEQQALEAHLAGCAECRRELEQFRGTVALLGRLPPVHAPAGFVDRVMGEAYRPPWPRRFRDALFRPLRVKLPLEAAAVLLVGVSALYVYQRAPEVQQVARQETPMPPPAAPAAPAQPPAPPVAGAAGDASQSKDADARAKRAPAEQEAARDKAGALEAPAAAAPPASAIAPAPTRPRENALEPPAAKTGAKPRAPPSELTAEVKPEARKRRWPSRAPMSAGAATSPGKIETFADSSDPSPSRAGAGPRVAPGAPPAAPAPPAATPASPPEARGHAGGLGSPPPCRPPRRARARPATRSRPQSPGARRASCARRTQAGAWRCPPATRPRRPSTRF